MTSDRPTPEELITAAKIITRYTGDPTSACTANQLMTDAADGIAYRQLVAELADAIDEAVRDAISFPNGVLDIASAHLAAATTLIAAGWTKTT